MSKKESLKERLETERRLSVNLAAAMEATKDLPEREVKAPDSPAKMEGDVEAMMEWEGNVNAKWMKTIQKYKIKEDAIYTGSI